MIWVQGSAIQARGVEGKCDGGYKRDLAGLGRLHDDITNMTPPPLMVLDKKALPPIILHIALPRTIPSLPSR